MAKITDNQLIVLSKATTREDGAAIVPQKMNKAAAMKVGSSLIGRTQKARTPAIQNNVAELRSLLSVANCQRHAVRRTARRIDKRYILMPGR